MEPSRVLKNIDPMINYKEDNGHSLVKLVKIELLTMLHVYELYQTSNLYLEYMEIWRVD